MVGGLLVQDRDWDLEDREMMEVVCGTVEESAWGDLLFAWRVCKHVTSNSIVIAKDLATIGIGAGQMSRVDSVRIALEKATELGHDLRGAVLASDAFFPFPDGPQLALDAGVRRSSSRAARSATARSRPRSRRRAPRWSSPAGATSGTDPGNHDAPGAAPVRRWPRYGRRS